MSLTNVPLTQEHTATALDIWERSVRATHTFLSEADITQLKAEVPFYFTQVDVSLWYDNENLIGFSGVAEDSLEMLFLDPTYFKQGFGSQILQRLVAEKNIMFIDVNEDNPNAVKFYNKNGFEQFDRSEKGGQGRDFPILHLRRHVTL